MIIQAFAIEQEPGKWKRKPAFRSRSGCHTCRTRHLKCDEVKPTCTRCKSSGFDCSIKSPFKLINKSQNLQQANSVIPPAPSLSQTPQQDLRSLDYFRHKTIPMFMNHFNVKFFNYELLQMIYTEPVLWHSTLALSACYEHITGLLQLGESTSTSIVKVAMEHYNNAVKLLTRPQPGKEQRIEIILVACLLFTYLEWLLGDEKTAMMHLRSGTKMMADWFARREGKIDRQLLERGLVSQLVSPFLDGLNLRLRGTAPFKIPSSKSITVNYHLPRPRNFMSLFEARSSLSQAMAEVSRFTKACEATLDQPNGVPQLVQHQGRFLTYLHEWSTAVEKLVEKKEMNRQDVSILRLQKIRLFIMVSTALVLDECKYDAHVQDFEAIITGIEKLLTRADKYTRDEMIYLCTQIYTLVEMVCLKCRNSKIRNRAMKILKERACKAIYPVVYIALRVNELEKVGMEDLRDPTGDIVPSEWARVQVSVVTESVGGSQKLKLVLRRRRKDNAASWYMCD